MISRGEDLRANVELGLLIQFSPDTGYTIRADTPEPAVIWNTWSL